LGKWGKKKKSQYGGISSSSSSSTATSAAKPDKDYQCQVLDSKKKRTRIRKIPATNKTKMMIMGPTTKNKDYGNAIPPLPSEDMMSFDTRHSTPRAKTKLHHQGYADVVDRIEHHPTVKKDSVYIMESSFVIPSSIDFISLLLPGGEDAKYMENYAADRNDEECSCVMSTSDAGGVEDATVVTSGAFSFMSGRTVLAKDRVQETISSTMNIDLFFNSSSPRSVETFPSFHQQDVPINVDFVLESSEDELAVFAKRCLTSGNFRDAIDIYESVLDAHMKQQKKNHRFVIPILHNLTVIHTWNGNYKRALYYCNQCLTWRREKLGYDHVDVAASLSELGIIHYAKEDFNKSLGALREALQIYSKANKPYRPNHGIARTLNNIGCIHFSTGKLSASLSTFEECLELQRRTMGSFTGARVDRMLFNMSVTLINAATVAEKQGNAVHASSLMEEGFIVLQSILPDDHRIVTSVRKALSRMESAQDQLTVNSSDSTVIQRSLLGGKELTLRQRLHNICNVKESPKVENLEAHEDLNLSCAEMLTIGSPKSALDVQERIQLHMNQNRLPQALIAEGNSKRHCSWVDINSNNESGRDNDFNFLNVSQKAAKYITRNDVQKAIKMFENLRQNHRTKCGDVTYILGTISFMLGIIYLYTAQYDQALSHFRDSMKIRSSVLDSDHSDVLASLSMIAITLIALKNFDVAQAHLEKVLRLTRKKYGYNDEKVAVVLNNIGLCHFEMGGLLTASKTFEECVEILREASNNEKLEANIKVQISIMQARSLNNLAFIRFQRREYADAIVALEEALKLQRRIFGDDSQVVKETLRNLGTCMATANCDNNKDKLEHIAEMYADMLAS